MTTLTHETMHCMDVWGGNQYTNSTISLPGLNLWVYSKPMEGSAEGGDVYFVSSCASGNITRLMMADVSGHGQMVSPVALRLHQLMRKNINQIDQTRFVESLNREFVQDAEDHDFATAIVTTFFSPTRKLMLHNAGHPSPFICRAGTNDWIPYIIEDEEGQTENIPLGVYEDMRFSPLEIELNEGDMALIYTDALPEARDREGQLLKISGLREQLNKMEGVLPEEIIPTLMERIQPLSEGNLAKDDTTVMLLQANGSSVGFFGNLMAPFRLLGEMSGIRKPAHSHMKTTS